MAICQRIACESDLSHDNRIADAALAATGSWDPVADMSGDNRITSHRPGALMILRAAADGIEI